MRGRSNFVIELIRIEGFEEQHWKMSFFERCRRRMNNREKMNDGFGLVVFIHLFHRHEVV